MIKSNIANLTALWQKAGEAFGAYHPANGFGYCTIEGMEWPNRLWFAHDITKETLAVALQQVKSSSIVIPYWDIYQSESFKLLEAEGYTVKSQQIAMCLELHDAYQEEQKLDFKQASTPAAFEAWSELFLNCFGYRIAAEVLSGTYQDITYYLVYNGEEAVGTALLFKTGEVMGIHSVGILPSQRRKGYAEAIMQFLLNRSIALGARYATLQASAMGKGLYDKLGFSEQFVIRNYALPKRYE